MSQKAREGNRRRCARYRARHREKFNAYHRAYKARFRANKEKEIQA